jgi:hypothetical protein
MRAVCLGILCAIALIGDTAGGIKFAPPADWKSLGQRPMRAGTYLAPAAAGDKEGAELAIFYFGQGQGGDVDANIKRWTAQFDTKEKPRIDKQTVNGMPVTMMDLSGTYIASSGPMMAAKTSKPGYRLLGAIVEGPQGAVFFKFTGPAKTVAAHQAAFQKVVKSVSK